jgi:hypothetical protein
MVHNDRPFENQTCKKWQKQDGRPFNLRIQIGKSFYLGSECFAQGLPIILMLTNQIMVVVVGKLSVVFSTSDYQRIKQKSNVRIHYAKEKVHHHLKYQTL